MASKYESPSACRSVPVRALALQLRREERTAIARLAELVDGNILTATRGRAVAGVYTPGYTPPMPLAPRGSTFLSSKS
jgi:hypothetical protein